ncbi:hypothetical protein JCM21900_002026 [Sporobolomyces salmonicolor]
MSSDGPYTAPPINFADLSTTPHSTSAEPSPPPHEPKSEDEVVDAGTLKASSPVHSSNAPEEQLIDSPAPAQAHPDPAASSAPPAAAKLSAADKAPAPATERPTGDDAIAIAQSGDTPASRSLPAGDQAPAPATESAPATSQRVADNVAAVPVEPTVVRPPTAATSSTPSETPVAQADTTPPATSKPIVPSAESHLAEHPATSTDTDHVLPLGSDVHPVHQAAALDEAPDHLVNAQIEKHKADMRQVKGEEPEGTIVPGLEDDKLWAMIRRFDVQITHTLTPPTKLPRGEPDLRPSTLPAVPFNSDELKSNLERVYATLGIWIIYGARELRRLMTWEEVERKRTAYFCTGYFIAAAFGMVIPAIMGLLVALLVYPPSRKFLFPPVPPSPGQPPSATDPTNQKGDESMLVGVGHPIEHRSRTEQIEQQAWEFTNVVQRFGVRVVVGGKSRGRQGNAEVGAKQHVSSGEEDEDSEPDSDEQELHDVARQEGLGAAAEKEKREKKLSDKQRQKQKAKEAKIKRDEMVGKMAKSTQDALGNIADLMEVFANAVNPPKPYPPYKAREKLAGAVFVPIALVFAIVPAQVWARISAFGFGFAFFGQPILIRAAKIFVEKVPDWQEKLDLRNSIFSGVPTNAQLVLHVVRVAERAYTPFPLPPNAPTAQHLKQAVQSGGIDEDTVDPDSSETHSVEAGALAGKDADEGDNNGDPSTKEKVAAHGKKRIVTAFKKVAKKAATFRADVHVEGDSTKQKVGNKIDRMFYQSRAKDEFTPTSFPAKFNGTSGHVVIKHTPLEPVSTISFVPLKASFQHPTFERPIEDIVEIKKLGVWIGRTVLGWAASINLEGMGLDLRFKHIGERFAEKAEGGLGEGDKPHEEVTEGDTLSFSHVARRDELFRRIIGISNARWELL